MMRHVGWWFSGVIVLLVATIAMAVMVGTTWIGPHRLLQILSQPASRDFVTVFNLRLPRIISSLICGGSLAVAGALFQAVFRNPIADPSILGISSAADFFKLGGVLLVPWLPGRQWLLALLGGVVALFILTRGRALRDPYRLIIIGVALDATFVGLSRLVSSGQTAPVLPSTFNATTWMDTWTLLILGLLGLLGALLLAPWANHLKLADTALQTIGVPVKLIRWSLLLLGTYLAVSVTAIVGAIPFVGIVVPNLARRLVGHDYQTLLPFSMLAGAWLMLAADTLGRTVIVPSEISAATMMAVIGGPFVIILLQRGRGFHGITTG
ncbi:iron ABC transporter permease [Levilactobacillus tujiorum]|uniref:Probable heme-iron transport system permease protein IsdF n=1 Tax=Levilactobacillus tujiorum TaxID=2912243 RepID=A0ABX1L9I1_9LACO|nr:iron ABC transporter permease [Levilactobacillus tujiorum]MCH5465522.1 iron ABC transporter permease [Levilactobacillus tujiorum]NLR12607.1 iron ABC transporter permease [Lactobacillus sp. HBUAS51387]NLR30532.1 iron ABC transporter permease [Levilactobacillus tujiorum]